MKLQEWGRELGGELLLPAAADADLSGTSGGQFGRPENEQVGWHEDLQG